MSKCYTMNHKKRRQNALLWEKNGDMNVVLGVDIGGSTTKIVALNEKKEGIATLQVKAADQITALYGAIGNLLYSNRISFDQVRKIVLTGVGSSQVEGGSIYDIPSCKVNEFEAIGHSGLIMSGLDETLVISMGTGTAFVHARNDVYEHIGGSGVGGGTLIGLATKMLGESDVTAVAELAKGGDVTKVDLGINEISNTDTTALPSYVTASNFGKIKNNVTNADIALGILNMVYQTAGMLAVFACRNTDIKTIVATGSVATLPQAEELLGAVGDLCGVKFIIPKEAQYATAIGAASLRFDD